MTGVLPDNPRSDLSRARMEISKCLESFTGVMNLFSTKFKQNWEWHIFQCFVINFNVRIGWIKSYVKIDNNMQQTQNSENNIYKVHKLCQPFNHLPTVLGILRPIVYSVYYNKEWALEPIVV